VISDAEQRTSVLDANGSYIVQAPAGSGKTELLIQRYLVLLARVEIPEQVLAITFTRKAAAEMRRRVLMAIEEAAAGVPPGEPHRATTFQLATAVLQRSRELDWSLELQPQRLRIDTLDAMNVWLAQHLSILAGGVGGAEALEDPSDCYVLAIRRTLEALGGGDELDTALVTLLRATDNNALRLERLLLDMLPTRDQWLPYLAATDGDELRGFLESALRRLLEESLEEIALHLPPGFVDEIVPLLRHAASVGPPDSATFAIWQLPETRLIPAVDSLTAWRAVAELLLTRDGKWRRRLSATHGFGVSHSAMRERLATLIAANDANDELRDAIARIRELPSAVYDDGEWQLIDSLRRVLRHLAAEVKVIFAEQRRTDFVELALSAQQALGRVDEPSELLLALDRRIQHVLVDEFQDTSHTQLRLLRLLTAGWEPGDGRTAFLVGDPMQSIYRFRHADMSLFLRTQVQGLANTPLESVLLENNFRSAPAIVSWVNSTFARVFPAIDDMGSGEARFHPCRATRVSPAREAVVWHPLRSDSADAEIRRVAEILREELRTDPEQSVAVLVRSRSHLIGLREQLRAAGLDVHAVELEAPCQRQIVQDLLGLTRALTHFGDRVAWLAVLRAPWCGLRWADLLHLSASDAGLTIWELMSDEMFLAGLTLDGRARAERVRAIIERALRIRASHSFARWIESTWSALGGPECLESADDAAAVERFFAVLANVSTYGDVRDPAALERHFAEPYGQGESPREVGVEIMTIHRAKGLEFDTVILLGLARKPRPDAAKALYWLERTAADGSEDLLLGPPATVADGAGLLTKFIRQADSARSRAEAKRLLYVATTRARNRLHLVARLGSDRGQPPAGSLLEYLWADVHDRFEESAAADNDSMPELVSVVPALTRLRELPSRLPTPRPPEPALQRPEFLWATHAAAQVGTIVHAVLSEIAAAGPSAWSKAKVLERRSSFERELALLGVDVSERADSVQRIIDALCAVLDDPRGVWLLERHRQAESELPLTRRVGDRLEHLRIDRTFVDENGVRWIVDFKTSIHEGADVDAFLDSEVERYREQLGRYADAMTAIDDRPIQLGLYFPLLQAFRSWQAEQDASMPR